MSDADENAPAPEDEGGVVTTDSVVTEDEAPKVRYSLEMEDVGACQKHIRITVPRDEVDRAFDEQFAELRKSAQIAGFRAGKSPARLVERRFRKEVSNQIKYKLVMETLEQIGEDHNLMALDEPKLDLKVIELPEAGDFTYEFKVEVAPQFDTPEYKGLEIKRTKREVTSEDVDQGMDFFMRRYATNEEIDGPAAKDDVITADIRFVDGDLVLSEHNEVMFRVDDRMSLVDAEIADFGQHMIGANVGDTREMPAKLSDQHEKEDYRGKDVTAVFVVQRIQTRKPIDPEVLAKSMGVSDLGELRDVVETSLKARAESQASEDLKDQVMQELLLKTHFDLPPDLLRKQSRRVLQRRLNELHSRGYSDEEVQKRMNDLTQDSVRTTSLALRSQFILAKISEAEKIDVSESDLEQEIEAMAARTDASVRQVRSRIEKENLWESVKQQIIEQKTIDAVVGYAKVTDVPYEAPAKEQVGGTTSVGLAVIPPEEPASEDEEAAAAE